MKLARTAVAVAAAALVVLVPSAANAASLLRTDTVGDVQTVTLDDQGNFSGDPVVVPTRTIGDITKTRITHSTTTVRVEMYYRALPKAGFINVHQFRFVTDELEREVSVVAGKGNWAGQSTMYTKAGNEYPCSTLRHLVDYTNKRVIVNVPRSCLSNPKFVKAGVGFAAFSGDTMWFDDGQVNAGNGDTLTLSPGVFR